VSGVLKRSPAPYPPREVQMEFVDGWKDRRTKGRTGGHGNGQGGVFLPPSLPHPPPPPPPPPHSPVPVLTAGAAGVRILLRLLGLPLAGAVAELLLALGGGGGGGGGSACAPVVVVRGAATQRGAEERVAEPGLDEGEGGAVGVAGGHRHLGVGGGGETQRGLRVVVVVVFTLFNRLRVCSQHTVHLFIKTKHCLERILC